MLESVNYDGERTKEDFVAFVMEQLAFHTPHA
jgi:hypothetical protein